MQTRSMRDSLLLMVVGCVLLLAAYAPAPALAATCPTICNQQTIWGTGPASTRFAPCECSTVINSACSCGICFQPVGDRVIGHVQNKGGSCPDGATDCGDCHAPSGSGSRSNSTKTTALQSTSGSASGPASPPLTSSPPVTASTAEPPSSTATSSSNDGLAAWQIMLIICLSVLAMAVVMKLITSCCCKTVHRKKGNQQNQEYLQEYEGYWNPNATGDLTDTEQLAQSSFKPFVDHGSQGGRPSSKEPGMECTQQQQPPHSPPAVHLGTKPNQISAAILARRRKKKAGDPSRPDVKDNGDVFLADANRVASSSVWTYPILHQHRIDKEEFVLRSCLTTSKLSEIWLATYAEQTVVVKKLGVSAQLFSLANALASSALDYFAALDHAGVTSHRNIVQVIAVSWSSALTTQVVMAYAEGGDLRALLDSKEAETLTWGETKCQLLLNVVDALAFFEAQAQWMQRPHNTSLVSSRNVLLDASGMAQLSLVQWDVEDQPSVPSPSLPGRYVAPEVIQGEKATASALIYSIGVLLAEIDTTDPPFAHVLSPNGQKAPDAVILKRIAKGDLQPTLRDDCPKRLAALARVCWAFDPTERPTIQRVAYTLRDILKNEL